MLISGDTMFMRIFAIAGVLYTKEASNDSGVARQGRCAAVACVLALLKFMRCVRNKSAG